MRKSRVQLKELVEDMLTNFDSDSDGDDETDNRSPRGCGHDRRQIVCSSTAAVSPDMTSVATAFTDDRCVQVFYARSDHAMNTWQLPGCVQFPVHSRSASRWEKALTTDCPLAARRADACRIVKKNTKKVWDVPVFLPEYVSQRLYCLIFSYPHFKYYIFCALITYH